MVEIRLQSIDDVAGFRMVIPEHAEVSDTDRGHERADHLVELTRGGAEDASECWVAHVEEWFYRGFD